MAKPSQPSPDLRSVLDRIPLFGCLSPAARAELAASLEPVTIPAGEVILRQGDEGNHYYFIVRGTAEVWATRGLAGQAAKDDDEQPWRPNLLQHALLAQLGPGDGFGETQLLFGGRSRVTVRAAADVLAYRLGGTALRAVIDRHRGLMLAVEEEMALRSATDFLGKPAPFAGQPPELVRWAAACLHTVSFAARQEILSQGEPGDSFYLILSGRVAALIAQPDGSQHQVATLGPGDPFGEMGLPATGRNPATLVALEPVVALRLGKDDFARALALYRDRQRLLVRPVFLRQRPRRRPGWLLEPGDEVDGHVLHVLRDAAGDYSLYLSEQAAFMWTLLDGELTVSELSFAFLQEYGAVATDAVAAFLMQLCAANAVQLSSAAEPASQAANDHAPNARPSLPALPPTLYLSLPRADSATGALYRYLLRPLFWRQVRLALLAGGAAGAVLFAFFLATGGVQPPAQASLLDVSAAVVLSWLIHAILHGVAHAAACKHSRRAVTHIGIGWHSWLPVAMVDTSDVWTAPWRTRAAVSVAGLSANLILAGFGTLLIPLVGDSTLRLNLYLFAAVGFALALVNLNPLASRDGYQALSEFLAVPNLRRRTTAFLDSALRHSRLTTDDARLFRAFLAYVALVLLYAILVAVVLFAAYSGYAYGQLARLAPPEVASAAGWLIALGTAALVLRDAWLGLRPGMEQERATQAPEPEASA